MTSVSRVSYWKINFWLYEGEEHDKMYWRFWPHWSFHIFSKLHPSLLDWVEETVLNNSSI